MISYYIPEVPLCRPGHDFGEEVEAVEIALLLLDMFGEETEESIELFMLKGRPTDHVRWEQVKTALSVYRAMHPGRV
ncbi:MAG: hypothetical protein ACR2Q4_09090 [Geminicoccaceae bacterium]|jgi:DNA-binding IclR family transcriptional regulator